MAAGKLLALLVVVVCYLLLSTIVAVDFDRKDNDQFEWHMLSAKNFSSQIRLYPHVLLFVTVPWCGESRSLMREISEKLSNEQQKYSSLKLMLVHRSRDKMLAESLGAAEGITVLCYNHAVSYKYQGSLRVRDILSSVNYLISLPPEDLPLKRIENSEDLEMFLSSTDKAILLLESCGWTPKLLAQHNGNETIQGGVLSRGLIKETYRTLASGRQKNLKEMENEAINCNVEDGCGGGPWVGEFTAKNGTAFSTNEEVQPAFEMYCSFKEYEKFQSFFSKFMAAARNLYLPPQRQRYGFVYDRSLLSSLDAEFSDPWSVVISYAGCPSCLRTFKEEKHLQEVSEMHDLPVMELEREREDLGFALPVDKPSILLFVDRTSESTETRRKSQEALHAFKEVAVQYWNSKGGRKSNGVKRSSLQNYEGSVSMFGDHRLLLSPSSQKIKSKDKMSIMILNEGKHITLDYEVSNIQSNSLHEILAYLLEQKKQSKLSSLAKKAGFQLLSDDMELRADVLSSQTESQSQDSAQNSIDVPDEGQLDMNNEQTNKLPSLVEEEEKSQLINAEAPFDDGAQKAANDLSNNESVLVDRDHETMSTVVVDSQMQTHAQAEKSEGLEHLFSSFSGSFFFCDGNYQLLRVLTNDSEVPRMVILDPSSQQHYAFSEVANFNIFSVSTFIDGFLNGSLIPYQHSGPMRNSIEMPHAPFVNLDFHEKDSIPCLTTETFSELVLGSSVSNVQNATNAWHMDVLVLFSNSWCGFCQRMELVVREVYRALRGYTNMVKCKSKNGELFSKGDVKDVATKLPAIYSVDCTLNECSWILKSIGQKEFYPTVLLFPAERKTAIPYNGNMMVTEIIKFMANHGTNSYHLSAHKGTLWTDSEERDNHENSFKATFTSGANKEFSDRKDTHLRAPLENGMHQNQVMFKLNEKSIPQNVAVGSFLVATESLHGLNPFSEARILIVGADHNMGFQGLIVNKPISWDSLAGFEDIELLKEAPLSFGGPVIHQEMPLVSLTRNSSNDQYPQVLPGIYFLDQLATISEIEEVKAGNRFASDYWFFLGYSGWSWDQLFNEIAEGAWSLHEENVEDIQWP